LGGVMEETRKKVSGNPQGGANVSRAEAPAALFCLKILVDFFHCILYNQTRKLQTYEFDYLRGDDLCSLAGE
jgi:hypothetical protein